MNQILIVAPEEENERLDSFLVKHFSKHSRVRLQRAIAAGKVLVDGKTAKSSTRLKPNQSINIEIIQPESEAPIPEEIELSILFEDEHVVAINKPPAMVVHPAKGHWQGTLTSALAFHFQNLSTIGGAHRPGIVHRLDRDTSGVILVAKNDQAHLSLSSQFQDRTIAKEYFALVMPAPNRDRDLIEVPIGAHPYQREKKAVRKNHKTSKSASTFFEVIERFTGFASVAVKPKTGRTHQIRVHMAHVGSAVCCDALYGGFKQLRLLEIDRAEKDSSKDRVLLGRHALHARRIEFDHPTTGKRIEVVAPIPADIAETLTEIRRCRS